MAMYMTKVWGLGEPCGPLQFSTSGARETARERLAEGDLVLLVGTQGEPTDPTERGRLLGLMEPTNQSVASLDFDFDFYEHDYDEDGQYKWPYALLNRRAWMIDEPRPFLKDISSRQFNMDAALGIVSLTDQEAAHVNTYPRSEIGLLFPVRAWARLEGEIAARRRGAPPPRITNRRAIMQFRRAPAYTYAMEIIGATNAAFKIGWAFDYVARQRTFNTASMPLIGGLQYRTRLKHLWGTARAAFHMEQVLLRHFDGTHPARAVFHPFAIWASLTRSLARLRVGRVHKWGHGHNGDWAAA